jgi:hypothetical protein
MAVYCGWTRETEVECVVVDLGCGAGQIDCLECLGDGDWKKFLNEEQVACMCPGDTPYPCVDCKGTGKMLVSI